MLVAKEKAPNLFIYLFYFIVFYFGKVSSGYIVCWGALFQIHLNWVYWKKGKPFPLRFLVEDLGLMGE